MKNVAILNTCDTGSTGKIAKGLFTHLKDKGYSCVFVYGRGNDADTEGVVKFEGMLSIYIHYSITKVVGTDGYGSIFATKRLVRQLKAQQVDTVYIVSVCGHYLNENIFFEYLTKENIKVVYIMIDEYAYLGGCSYSDDCQKYTAQCADCPHNQLNPVSRALKASHRRFLSKSAFYKQLTDPVFVGPEYTIISSKRTGLLDGMRTVVLDEAINTSLFSPQDAHECKAALGIPEDKIVIVCVAPYSYKRKGVRFFYEAARRMQQHDRFLFVHVGYDGGEAICLPNLIVKGFEFDQTKLCMYYSMADLFVFPSLLDTMPNACLEALSCGTPLLCFNISGMPYIANDEVAHFVEAENVDELLTVIERTEKKTDAVVSKCRAYALERYDSQKYFEALERLGNES